MKLVNISNNEKVTLFNTIAIEISSLCNRHCHFCPNDEFKRVDEYMSSHLIIKMLEELRDLKYTGRIEWYIYNEPTRDKRIKGIIRTARLIVPRACQMVNTNGDYFKSARDIEELFDAGLNQMQINVYSASDSSTDPVQFNKGIGEANEREDRFQSWLNSLTDISQTGSLYQNIGPRKKVAQVVPKYGIVKTTGNEGVNKVFSNRAGNIPNFKTAVKEPLPRKCVRPFRFLNINWKGDSLLCCCDYYGEVSNGNANESSLVDIWNGSLFNLYRMKLQAKRRDMHLCKSCDFDGGHYQHMTDTITTGSEEEDARMRAYDNIVLSPLTTIQGVKR